MTNKFILLGVALIVAGISGVASAAAASGGSSSSSNASSSSAGAGHSGGGSGGSASSGAGHGGGGGGGGGGHFGGSLGGRGAAASARGTVLAGHSALHTEAAHANRAADSKHVAMRSSTSSMTGMHHHHHHHHFNGYAPSFDDRQLSRYHSCLESIDPLRRWDDCFGPTKSSSARGASGRS
jgi:hypothetical protein